MQFSISAGGKPAEVKQAIDNQAAEIKKGSSPQAAAATASIAGGLMRYVDSQTPEASVSIFVQVSATVNEPAAAGTGG